MDARHSHVSAASHHGNRLRRRQALRFLAGLGVTAPLATLLPAIDAALNDASAQPAPGQPVPKLGVYLPNWPDQVELWRQLSREWQAIGIELDLQQGTLDTFVSQIVADTLKSFDLSIPTATVDLAGIRRKYHAAEEAG